ncbi:hypothetical protein [Agrobacterium tumefaciens]|uniref:Uncharacterized protein n=1 Tax=Agrobacterium tumefaciens TaxID=358 RepID=A0AA44F6P2_AGRTU|nr:hypothetical protein [Agrobacterium tumefaciens]NSL24920.1 hypothetical protein [Agrobacterium tumefaciens]NTB86575.1 hypothetical protein [Agrobacterium tumefaciens]NTC20903.1 hypothetical protein [Agrobacterium tumefaciens]NTC30452.1 hypothetical protein [Agrobacterium tumefaciens]NTC54090.1 hypothetical protein [Agrobacterium tumefaciens]
MSNAPRYSGQSPLLRRLVNDAPADGQECKIGSNPPEENRAKSVVEHDVNGGVPDTCAVGHQHTLTIPSINTPKKTSKPHRSKALQASVARMGDIGSKPWRTLWQHEKLARSFEAAGRQNGRTFTLNLDPAREKLLLSRRDPADDLRRRISRELKSALGYLPAYGFTFEVSPSGRLHVHGVLILKYSSDTDMKLVREALARAGGRMMGKAAPRQVAFAKIEDGFGWAAYCQKAFDTACNWLGTNKVSYVSTDLLRLAKG